MFDGWFGLKWYLWFAESNQRICFLNVSPDEVIRSLFYNKNNDSLITVSVYASDNFSSLKCRTTRIECVISFISLADSNILGFRFSIVVVFRSFAEIVFLWAIKWANLFNHPTYYSWWFAEIIQIHKERKTRCWVCSFWVWVTEVAWFCRVWWCKWKGSHVFCSGQVLVGDFFLVMFFFFLFFLWTLMLCVTFWCALHIQCLQGIWFEELYNVVLYFWQKCSRD